MNLNEIFVTKMCHDLAGSIGVLDNTTELLKMDSSFVEEGTDLLKQSTGVLVARLRLYRALLGLNSPITLDIALKYLDTLPMPISLMGQVQKKEHLIFVLMASEILVRGGSVELGENNFVCSGKSLFLDETKKKILLENEQNEKPQYAVVLWLQDWMKKNNLKVEIFQNEEALSMRFLSVI
ncbi:MAG: hypothetical protein IJY92_05075 [Alphaproteobacteria bacterium]|nr:hypothetical protein [Alphaproteobacteria bacterium]